MEIHLSPEIERRLHQMALAHGKDAEQLVKDTIARMLDNQALDVASVETGIVSVERDDLIHHEDAANCYRFHVEFVSQEEKHACAALQNERGSEKNIYIQKDRPVWSGVFVNKDAPTAFYQIDGLLKEIGRLENGEDAPTALNLTAALPEKLTDQERQWMATDFLREEFLRRHLAAVAHIRTQNEESDDGTPFLHILVGTHLVGPNGFGENVLTHRTYDQHVRHWREKWAALGARYLEKSGHKLAAEQWREGYREDATL